MKKLLHECQEPELGRHTQITPSTLAEKNYQVSVESCSFPQIIYFVSGNSLYKWMKQSDFMMINDKYFSPGDMMRCRENYGILNRCAFSKQSHNHSSLMACCQINCFVRWSPNSRFNVSLLIFKNNSNYFKLENHPGKAKQIWRLESAHKPRVHDLCRIEVRVWKAGVTPTVKFLWLSVSLVSWNGIYWKNGR